MSILYIPICCVYVCMHVCNIMQLVISSSFPGAPWVDSCRQAAANCCVRWTWSRPSIPWTFLGGGRDPAWWAPSSTLGDSETGPAFSGKKRRKTQTTAVNRYVNTSFVMVILTSKWSIKDSTSETYWCSHYCCWLYPTLLLTIYIYIYIDLLSLLNSVGISTTLDSTNGGLSQSWMNH